MSKVVTAHPPINLPCPHCRTMLRLRRRPGDPSEFDCPDCHRRLELFEEGDELRLRLAAPAVEAKAAGPARAVIPSVSFEALSLKPRHWWSRSKSVVASWAIDPLAVMWMIAGIAAVGIGIAFWQTHESSAKGGKGSIADAREISTGVSEKRENAAADEDQLSVIQEPVEAPRGLASLPRPVEAARPPASRPPDPREMIAEALSRKLLRFEQPTPVGFDLLRFQIEEMTGIAIEYDESAGAETREQNVTVSLQNVTLGELVSNVAGQVGLKPVIDVGGIRLVPDASTKSASASVGDDVIVGP